MKKPDREERPALRVSSETRESLFVLLYIALAGVSTLALLGTAGYLGNLWSRALTALSGVGRWLLPLLFVFLAAVRAKRLERRGVITAGVVLLVLSLLALIDFRLPLSPEARALEPDRLGGGYLALVLRFPLQSLLGPETTVFLLVLLAIGALLVTFDVTLSSLSVALFGRPASFLKGFVRGVRDVGGSSGASITPTVAAMSSFMRRPVRSLATETPPIVGGEGEQASLPLASTEDAMTKTATRFKAIAVDVPLTLLERSSGEPTSGDIRANKLTIERTLQSFGIAVEMGEVSVGPTVTQFTLKPDEGVKLSAITALQNDLALALAAHPIRMEAPIPGKSLVGIEVPNKHVATVQLRDILESEPFQKRRTNLALALGKDVAGAPWVVDLERLPHVLVAGATGSGKSVCLNGLILSLLYENTPADLRFILVDPKRVEFSVYQHMPHLLAPVITEVPATVNALKWLLKEMDRRFSVLSASGDRNIQTYNKRADEKMPYIILVIDELADLMVAAASEVEGAIIRLAQMARAVGIHLILATQRPSVDVLTGLIKANITARIAFAVASLVDSRTILDSSGAEKLVGRGDMLYVSAEVTKPKRVQCAFVGDEEIRKVVAYLKEKAAPDYIPEVTEKQKSSGGGGYGGDDGGDSLYGEAEAIVTQTGKASASFLQRRLKVGYARAARLLDLLEANGVIGPGAGAKPRDVLIRQEADGILEDDAELLVEDEDPDFPR